MVEWWTHGNLSALWEWLASIGCEPHDGPAYFMEKPWKWNTEYDAYLAVTLGEPPLNTDLGEVIEWLYDHGLTEEASELEQYRTDTTVTTEGGSNNE